MNKKFILKCIFLFFLIPVSFASEVFDPCASGLLAWVNRPSTTGSPCVIPNKKVVIEGGYQYLNLTAGAYGYNTPQTEIRFGLPGNNEFLIITPTFLHQTFSPRAGWTAPTLSFKHEIGYNQNWLGAVEGLLTLPMGSENYGSDAFAGTVNGIVTYTFNPVFSVTGLLGIMSQSVEYIQQGQRFNSINPDILATWQWNDKWLTFVELYAQTRTGPGEGLGLLTDAAIFYLPTPSVSLDAEIGQRITGAWGFQSYVGVGFGWLFG